jgi:DNA-binding FadR family transcriptional regulator
MDVDRLVHHSRADMIVARLSDSILSGRLNEGELLPAEEALHNYLFMNTVSFLKLVDVRMAIEPRIAALAAVNRQKNHLKSLKQSLLLMEHHQDSPTDCVRLDDAFHETLIDAAGNELFFIILRPIMSYLHVSRELTLRRSGTAKVISEHTLIVDAIEKKDPRLAEEHMEKHLNSIRSDTRKIAIRRPVSKPQS